MNDSNWKCEICGQADPRIMFILPLLRANGNLNTMACEGCAKKSSAYCLKHDCQHTGFIDGSTACLRCIQELVESKKDEAPNIRDRLRQGLAPDQAEDLDDAAGLSAELNGSSESVAILRFLASKAMRTNQTVEDIIHLIAESKKYPLNYLFW